MEQIIEELKRDKESKTAENKIIENIEMAVREDTFYTLEIDDMKNVLSKCKFEGNGKLILELMRNIMDKYALY